MKTVFRNGRHYVYRSVRRDGRVISEYVGRGELFAALADLVNGHAALRRQGRELDRRRERDWADRLEAEERDVVAAYGRVGALAAAALTSAGFHLHKRG